MNQCLLLKIFVDFKRRREKLGTPDSGYMPVTIHTDGKKVSIQNESTPPTLRRVKYKFGALDKYDW